MTNLPCDNIRNMLVDYVDGTLSEPEAQVVAGHLADCSACRITAETLTRSLDLAQAIWRDNLEPTAQVRNAGAVSRILHHRRYMAVAAALLFATGGALLLCTLRPARQTPAPQAVEQYALRAGAAARLLAATQVLARCEGTESLVEQQYQYILSRYPDTPAASELKAHFPSTLKGTRYD